jgi:hypothetical protein
MAWRDTLKKASLPQTLSRAQSMQGKKTIYKFGKGGIDPSLPLTHECDCTGFICWSIGRELPPGSERWLNTDAFWNGGVPVHRGLFNDVPLNESQVGDLIVYPHGWEEAFGHIGLVVQTDNNKPSLVIHCSDGNYKHFGDAIRITNPDVFLLGNHHTNIMRIDYDLLKTLFLQNSILSVNSEMGYRV